MLPELLRVIRDRKENPTQESYNRAVQLTRPRCARRQRGSDEFILAIKNKDDEETAAELADLIYHTMVAVVAKDIDPSVLMLNWW